MFEPKHKIYIGGPFTGQEFRNTAKAIKLSRALMKHGPFTCYVPHLMGFMDYLEPLEYEECMDHCFQWLYVSDAMVYLDNSPGTNREIDFCNEFEIPVFRYTEVDAFFDYFDINSVKYTKGSTLLDL